MLAQGVREHFLEKGLMSAGIPAHCPVPLEDAGKVSGRRKPGELETLECDPRVENPGQALDGGRHASHSCNTQRSTPAHGPTMTDVVFRTPAGDRSAYLATPDGEGPWPGVLLVHEIFGLNDDMRALCHRVAAMGYLVLAPDFYAGGRWSRCMRGALRQLEAGDGEFPDAIESGQVWLSRDSQCTGRVGVIGFSLGGGFGLLAAAKYPFSAASVNYAEVPDDAEPLLAGACPIIASYGGRDRTTRGVPERLQHALAAAGVEHDVATYPLAGHSFLSTRRYPRGLGMLAKLMGMNAGPHEPSADRAWDRIDAFFGKHLRAEQ